MPTTQNFKGAPRNLPLQKNSLSSQVIVRIRKSEMDAILRRSLNMQNVSNQPTSNSCEEVLISSLALLKMLKHGREGVPLEVMGLMLGEYVDEFTVNVVDVFAMPQTGTGVSVEAVDPVFQTKMTDLLARTNRKEIVVGWYHSHPGFGCWLSNVDVHTQHSFEQLHSRAVAVVIDPVQSVRGKVVIDAFRSIKDGNPLGIRVLNPSVETREVTSNLGYLDPPSVQSIIHGLNQKYYSINVRFNKKPKEHQMLTHLCRKSWTSALTLEPFDVQRSNIVEQLKTSVEMAREFEKKLKNRVEKNQKQNPEADFGKRNPIKHLGRCCETIFHDSLMSNLVTMLNKASF